MGYEKEVLSRARLRYAQSVEAYRQDQRRLQAKIYLQCPQIKALDGEIRQTMADVMAHAFRYGEDPQDAVAKIRQKNLHLQQQRVRLLRDMGYRPEQLEDGPRCRKCSDTGYVGEQMCECLRAYCLEEQRKELTSLLSSDKTFDDFSLDYYPEALDPILRVSPRQQMETIYELCVDYARHFTPHRAASLLFCGGTGLGKTFLSACIAQEVVGRGYSVVYDTAIHVFSCLEKQKFGGGTAEELRMADRILECDLLILDDLGTEMPTSFISPALYSVVNGRILGKKPTIISTNFSIDQLAHRYTPQIESRLRGEFQILNFLGNDIRRLKKMQ
jgi:DNA replication protein DnaC